MSNDRLKEINIKNRSCYYFNDIMFDSDNILVDKKLHED